MNLLEQILNRTQDFYHQLDPQMQLIWLVITSLIPLIILVIISHITINSLQLNSIIKNDYLKKEIKILLLEFLFDEESKNAEHVKKIKSWVNEKTYLMNRKREVLRSSIYEYHKNIKGELSYKLEWLYISFNFDLYLIKKYNHSNTLKKIWIIRELSQMGCHKAIPLLKKNCHNSNESIFLEAQLGLIRFKKFQGLIFLIDLTVPISNWNQLVILKSLEEIKGIEKQFNPILFLKSHNDSVVIFGLKYSQQFFRLDHKDFVVLLLNHINPEVQLEVLNTLEILQIQDEFDKLNKLYNKTAYEYIKVKIVKVVISLYPTEKTSFLTANLEEASGRVKFEIAKELKMNNPTINIEHYLRAATENQELNLLEL